MKGLIKDKNWANLLPGSSPFVRNMVYTFTNGVPMYTNEEGFDDINSNNAILIGQIPTQSGVILFFTFTTGVCEIGYYNVNTGYTTIIKDPLLGFKVTNPIDGLYFINNKQEIIACWWDGLAEDAQPPKILNINCLPFDLNVDKSFINPSDVGLLNLFTTYTDVDMALLEVTDTGGSLESGAYYITVAVVYPDESVSSYFKISNPIYITDDKSTVPFSVFDGCPAGTVTSKAIRFKILGINTAFDKVSIGIIKKIGGVTSAILLSNKTVTNGEVEFTYANDDNSTDVALDSLLIPTQSYERVQTGTVLYNKLYFGNLKGFKRPNIQPYVNNWKAKWTVDRRANLSKYQGSFKDPLFCFDSKAFKSGEVYALYAIVHFKNGDVVSYPIPGRAPQNYNFIDDVGGLYNVDERLLLDTLFLAGAVSSNLTELNGLADGVKLHEVYNTALPNGTMGYWENNDETYPDTDCWDVRNTTGDLITTIRNAKVRHHKFPTMAQLTTWYSGNSVAPIKIEGTQTTLIFDAHVNELSPSFHNFIINTDNTLSFSVSITANPSGHTNTGVLFNKARRVRLEVGAAWQGANPTTGKYKVVRSRPTFVGGQPLLVNLIEFIYDGSDGVSPLSGCQHAFTEVEAGDTIWWEMEGFSGPVLPQNDNMYVTIFDYDLETYTDLDNNASSGLLLGVQLLDCDLPNDFKNQIAYIELGFAERTLNNQTILGNGFMGIDNVTKVIKGYPFDMLHFQTPPTIDYVDTQILFESWRRNTNPSRKVSFHFKDRGDVYVKNKIIRRSRYLPAFTYDDYFDNTNRESCLYGEFDSDFIDLGLSPDVQTLQYDVGILTDFKIFKRSVYKEFKNQNIINTGASITLGETNSIYGGDSYFSMYGFYRVERYTKPVEPNIGFVILAIHPCLFFCESIANVSLRHDLPLEDNKYTPKRALFGKDSPNENGITFPQFIAPTFLPTQQDNIWSTYNHDYHAINNLQLIEVYECKEECNPATFNHYPFRVHRSLALNKETSDFRWRQFLVNDYYEMPRDKGVLWKLTNYHNSLLIHHEYCLFVTTTKERLATTGLTVFLGDGDIFDRLPDIVMDTKGNYAGTRHKFGAFVCKLGYVFVDSSNNSGKVFIYNGQLNEISNRGNREWFEANFKFPIILDGFVDSDNPYWASGITGVWDEHNNRLIISKIVRVSQEIDPLTSWTLSYNPDLENFASEHDYLPSALWSTEDGVYSVNNYANNEIVDSTSSIIWKHNIPNLYGYYYGQQFPCFIDVVIGSEHELNSIWQFIEWDSFALDVNRNVLYETGFTHFAVYTINQCSGLTLLKTISKLASFRSNTREVGHTWRFNVLRDSVIYKFDPYINSKGDFIGSNLNQNRPFTRAYPITSKTIIVRLYLNNDAQNRVYLSDVRGKSNPTLR